MAARGFAEPNPIHTCHSTCRLSPVTRPWAGKGGKDEEIPPVAAQYFYSSPISIDDPLCPAFIPTSGEAKPTTGPIRPFSPGDNNALERAWFTLADDDDRANHTSALKKPFSSSLADLDPRHLETLARVINPLAQKHVDTHGPQLQTTASTNHDDDPTNKIPLCCADLPSDVEEALSCAFCPLVRRRYAALQSERVIQEVVTCIRTLSPGEPPEPFPTRPRSRSRSRSLLGALPQDRETGTDGIRKRLARDSVDSSAGIPRPGTPASLSSSPGRTGIPIHPRPVDDGISGKPFVRVGSPVMAQPSAPSSFTMRPGSADRVDRRSGMNDSKRSSLHESKPKKASQGSQQDTAINTKVLVGISRLHMVSLPNLHMKPIYWSPVNDVATVLRATWFYSETMVPVDPVVANQLEAGYRELHPYAETWNDELLCAIEVGPLGEEKVTHKLWPEPHGASKNDHGDEEPTISKDPSCAARCHRGEAATEGSLEVPDSTKDKSSPARPFSSYYVIYKDKKHAFLLKPSLRPSAYYKRRPVAKIVRGGSVGIPVVRGFDPHVWDRAHEKKGWASASHIEKPPHLPPDSATSQDTSHDETDGPCIACERETERHQVTDLVLVAHGIGQKFAERVESFHFTHAINAFRREVNIELANPAVKSALREDGKGIMVLPVNWRHKLSLEDGGPGVDSSSGPSTREPFNLKDIEPTTIPAVRSLISDVMFDIPFYMSHHKKTMIETLVAEANRVYRLWCTNNSGFSQNGRVHIIAHSLGSAMALDILSNQPTSVPPLDLTLPQQPKSSFFEFDTHNLFLCGSPAAFFLLLNHGTLIPRRGHQKPGTDPNDINDEHLTAETGQFGCLAVDNVYNVLAKEDPIAYLLNGTIDAGYAASLKVAYVPSTATSMWDAVRSIVPGMTPSSTSTANNAMSNGIHGAATNLKPPAMVSLGRLPSQLELEVHDFTREEIAEKKAYLLNDNGQIDYYLRRGVGPLELQYLNMLSAHSSYWLRQDFVRMVCVEVGRVPGREGTVVGMRAVKKGKRVGGSGGGQ